jgi:hypothetical protein
MCTMFFRMSRIEGLCGFETCGEEGIFERKGRKVDLGWLGGASVCLYAQVLGLDGYAAVPRVGLGPTTPP